MKNNSIKIEEIEPTKKEKTAISEAKKSGNLSTSQRNEILSIINS